jgi:hypothetical protein
LDGFLGSAVGGVPKPVGFDPYDRPEPSSAQCVGTGESLFAACISPAQIAGKAAKAGWESPEKSL